MRATANSFQIFVNVIQDGKNNNKPDPPVLCYAYYYIFIRKSFPGLLF